MMMLMMMTTKMRNKLLQSMMMRKRLHRRLEKYKCQQKRKIAVMMTGQQVNQSELLPSFSGFIVISHDQSVTKFFLPGNSNHFV